MTTDSEDRILGAVAFYCLVAFGVILIALALSSILSGCSGSSTTTHELTSDTVTVTQPIHVTPPPMEGSGVLTPGPSHTDAPPVYHGHVETPHGDIDVSVTTHHDATGATVPDSVSVVGHPNPVDTVSTSTTINTTESTTTDESGGFFSSIGKAVFWTVALAAALGGIYVFLKSQGWLKFLRL